MRKNIAATTTSVFLGLLSIVTITTATTTLVLARDSDTHRQNIHTDRQQLRTSALDNANDLIDKGNTFTENNQYEQALTAYNRAARLIPEFPTAYFMRGILFYKMHRYEDAIADFTKATADNFETHPAPYHNRALAYIALYQEQQQQQSNRHTSTFRLPFVGSDATDTLIHSALADLNRAIAISPNQALLYRTRGDVYALQLRQYERALHDYDRAIALHPDYADAYVQRGNILQKLGNHSNAVADFNRALRFSSQSYDLYYSRGVSYLALGNQNKARSDLNESIRLAEHQNDTIAVMKAYDRLLH